MIVKQTEDACVAQRWSESAIECFMHAGTAAALHTCDRELAPQPAGAAGAAHHDPVIEGHVNGTGSGSGSGSGLTHSHRTRSHATHATHTTHSTR